MSACRRTRAGLAAAALLAVLAGACSAPLPVPTMYSEIGVKGIRLDKAEAARLVNSYRQARGLAPLRLDSALSAVAEDHSADMARHDRLGHVVSRGSFAARLKKGRITASHAAENVGAGYRTIAQAFSGWRGSAGHNRNMLLAEARRMGIAAAYAPHSKYKVFWTLIVASDEQRRPPGPRNNP